MPHTSKDVQSRGLSTRRTLAFQSSGRHEADVAFVTTSTSFRNISSRLRSALVIWPSAVDLGLVVECDNDWHRTASMACLRRTRALCTPLAALPAPKAPALLSIMLARPIQTEKKVLSAPPPPAPGPTFNFSWKSDVFIKIHRFAISTVPFRPTLSSGFAVLQRGRYYKNASVVGCFHLF